MGPLIINGELWRVIRVPEGDPRLIDRTDTRRLATTDPATMTISVSDAVRPPLLDRVVLHEVAHAITVSYGILEALRANIPMRYWVPAEEWAAKLVEGYGMEAAALASRVLGRPACVRGYCDDRP